MGATTLLNVLRQTFYAVGVALLAACSSTPALRETATLSRSDEAFEIAGRLSAKRGSDAAAANFRWSHRPDRDELTLATPLGSALARLEGAAGRVRLALPDGRVADAADWETLMTQLLGAPIPVRGLAWWLRGTPRPGTPHTIERDAASRPSVLWQDGWEVVYGYSGAGERPTRVRLVYPDTEIRLVIDSWNDAS